MTRARLTPDAIARAALAVVDAEGVEALTMRRLGRELGVEAMALYHHVPNKATLLDAVAAHVAAEAQPTVSGDADWRAGLRVLAEALRGALLAHPRAVPLVATRPLDPATGMRLVSPVLPLLRSAGFADAEAFLAIQSVAAFTIGHALAQAGGGEPTDPDKKGQEAGDNAPDDYYDEWYDLGLGAMIAGLTPRADRP